VITTERNLFRISKTDELLIDSAIDNAKKGNVKHNERRIEMLKEWFRKQNTDYITKSLQENKWFFCQRSFDSEVLEVIIAGETILKEREEEI